MDNVVVIHHSQDRIVEQSNLMIILIVVINVLSIMESATNKES